MGQSVSYQQGVDHHYNQFYSCARLPAVLKGDGCSTLATAPVQDVTLLYPLMYMWLSNNIRLTSLPPSLSAVVRAASVAAKDPNGRSDPYCVIYLAAASGEHSNRTEVQHSTLDPEWKEMFTFNERALSPFVTHKGRLEASLTIDNQLAGLVKVVRLNKPCIVLCVPQPLEDHCHKCLT